MPKTPTLTSAALGAIYAVAALGASVAAAQRAAPAERPEARERAEAPQPPSEPDIVVRGRRWGELRFAVQIAEEALYARFNEINSDDRFDIHCRSEKRFGATRMKERRCLSNSWREQDANIGEEALRAMRGEPGGGVQQYQAEQLAMQRRLYDEMRRLALLDEGLKQAVMELGSAQIGLAAARGRPPDLTREREVVSDVALPFDAQRIFEVQIGADPWSHALTQQTFTIARVSGEIRGIDLDCEGGRERLDYEPDVDWTVPNTWSACIVRVRAQRDTTFALYEF